MSREASPELLSRIADRLKALADPTRLAILHALETRERNVTDLLGELGGSQANLSKHLARMRMAGLLAARRDGTSVYYRIADDQIYALCDLVCGNIARQFEQTARDRKAFVRTATRAGGSPGGSSQITFTPRAIRSPLIRCKTSSMT